MDVHGLAVHLRPGVRSLASLVSVLHARRVDLAELAYAVDDDRARVMLRCVGSQDQVVRLARQLDRCVDVLSADVVTGGHVRCPHADRPADSDALAQPSGSSLQTVAVRPPEG